jgi:hypothetical protein
MKSFDILLVLVTLKIKIDNKKDELKCRKLDVDTYSIFLQSTVILISWHRVRFFISSRGSN